MDVGKKRELPKPRDGFALGFHAVCRRCCNWKQWHERNWATAAAVGFFSKSFSAGVGEEVWALGGKGAE